MAKILYDANYDKELVAKRNQCHDLCHQYNQLLPTTVKERKKVLQAIIGEMEDDLIIEQPFYCDYGTNIRLGKQVYLNMHTIMLDAAEIYVEDHVFVGPNCAFYTAGHPFSIEDRRAGLEYALPIHVEEDVWIGGNTVVMAGVTIGKGSVIGAGSVVTKDIPPYVLAAGNPCRIIRSIKEEAKIKSDCQ